MSEQAQAVPERETYLWRGERRYKRLTPRTVAPKRSQKGETPFAHVCWQVLPWGQNQYPGIYAGLEEILGHRVSRETIKCWVNGRRRPPAWAVELLTSFAARRAEAILQAVRSITDPGYTDRGPGFRKVDPVTGQDGRAKTGRRGLKPI